MIKRIVIDNQSFSINVDKLIADLEDDNMKFVSLSLDGDLLISDDGSVERWIARVEGCGVGNSYWGDLPGGYEFCGGAS
jgi:hypothetical protein